MCARRRGIDDPTDYDPSCHSRESGNPHLAPGFTGGSDPRKKLNPKQISSLRILDPACGSGSFLLGAYTYLLDYHRDWYLEQDPASSATGKYKKKIYQGKGAQWFLTIAEKKRILLNNIFGVDIDSQAVEVTKLSLLLKVLEGETAETVGQTYKFLHERALPDLADNIKCGNSLIGPDFFDNLEHSAPDDTNKELRTMNNEQQTILDDLHKKINPFDYKTEFPQVFSGKTPGFHAVIGNPPWLMAGYYLPDCLEYLRRQFISAHGKFDMYYTFIEKAFSLLSDDGLFAMIVPNKFFHTKAAFSLRSFLSKSKCISSITDFGDQQIFSGATNYSCLLFLQKQPTPTVRYAKSKKGLQVIREFEVPWAAFLSSTWHFEEQDTRNLFEKIETSGDPLEKITTRFGSGVQTGADRLLTMNKNAAKDRGLETELLRPLLRGRDVRRYVVSTDPKLVIFPYAVKNNEFVLLSEAQLQNHNNVYDLLVQYKTKLGHRLWFGKSAQELSGKWYGMMYLDAHTSFIARHILTPSLSNSANFALGTGALFATGTAGVTSIIPKTDITESILYLIGLLNSSLLSFYVISHSPVFSGRYYKFSSPYLRKLPIRRINFSDSADKSRHDKMVALVERMLDLHKKFAAAKVPAEKTQIQRQITTTDKQIDQLTYELYNLTEEEIKIVEEST